MTELLLRCEDGATLKADVIRSTTSPTRGAIVIAPALGVPRAFYTRYAAYLASRGYHALLFDYRGIGGSGAEIDLAEVRLEHWGERDLQAALIAARREFGVGPLYLVGHSIGGQVPGLSPASEGLSGLVLVAASAPHPSRYRLRDRLPIEFMWRVLVPLLGRGRVFPARKVGFASVDLPGSVVRRWRDWGLTRDYLFDGRHGLDTARYARLHQPVLAYSFADDAYASREAVSALLAHYPAARIEHRHVEPMAGKRLGHFGYFRDSQRDTLWAQTVDWLSAH
ncbi:MAG TPA: alpha/beta fold hydrolase [Solimonas sp.]